MGLSGFSWLSAPHAFNLGGGELFLSSIESTDRRFELHLSRNEENMSGKLQTLHVGSTSQPGTCQFHALDPTSAGWFLKHRCGVKGQSVYFYASLGELQDRLKSLRTCSAQDFIVQQAVQPLLLRGRKFVLRAHVLLTAAPQPQVYVHSDVIVLQHAKLYSCTSTDRAVHISSCGTSHPKPCLLHQVQPGDLSLHPTWDSKSAAATSDTAPPCWEEQTAGGGAGSMDSTLGALCTDSPVSSLPSSGYGRDPVQQSIWRQICRAAGASMGAGIAAGLVPPDADPSACLYHLFGYDFAVDPKGRLRLLEEP